MKNKELTWIYGASLIVAIMVTPILFHRWKNEQEKARFYRENFFHLWNQVEEIKNQNKTAEEVLNYLNELTKTEEMINWLAGKAKEAKIRARKHLFITIGGIMGIVLSFLY